MKIISLLIIMATTLVAAQANEGTFWVIRTDSKTADALIRATQNRTMSADDLGKRITKLVRGNKITELLRIRKGLGGGTIKEEKLEGKIYIPKIKETIPMGITFEAEPMLSSNKQSVDLRFITQIYEKESNRRHTCQRITSAATIEHGYWHLLHLWKHKSETTLLLTRLHVLSEQKNTGIPQRSVVTQCDLVEVSKADLKKYRDASPETKAKARTWLLGRGKPLRSTKVTTRSGEKTVHEDLHACLFNKNGWDTAYLGFLLELETRLGHQAQKIDLTIKADWQAPATFKETPDYYFSVSKTMASGESIILEPSKDPNNGNKTVALILTSTASTQALSPATPSTPRPIPDAKSMPKGKFTHIYAVKPSYLRVLGQKFPSDKQRSSMELLKLHGMQFPKRTFANIIPSNSTVVVHHTKEGHLEFQKILRKHNLLP